MVLIFDLCTLIFGFWTLDFGLWTWWGHRSFIPGRLVGQGRDRDIRNCFAVVNHLHATRIANAPDHDRIEVPLAKDVHDLALAAGVSNYQHALLRF